LKKDEEVISGSMTTALGAYSYVSLGFYPRSVAHMPAKKNGLHAFRCVISLLDPGIFLTLFSFSQHGESNLETTFSLPATLPMQLPSSRKDTAS
jgi:hypothetical protein